MSNLNEQVTASDGRQFGAYASKPAKPNGNAIVLLQEIFGVTSTIRKVADRYAEDGYLVYAPDLFWRLEPGLELSHSKEDIGRAMKLKDEFDVTAGLSDIGQTIAHVRALPNFNGKIAVVGLCMGGMLSYRAATQLNVDAGVSYYGVGIDSHLDEADQLRCPLILHFGKKDAYVPEPALATINSRLASKPNVEMYVYENADHGFYTRGDAADIETAHQRTEAFLQKAFAA